MTIMLVIIESPTAIEQQPCNQDSQHLASDIQRNMEFPKNQGGPNLDPKW